MGLSSEMHILFIFIWILVFIVVVHVLVFLVTSCVLIQILSIVGLNSLCVTWTSLLLIKLIKAQFHVEEELECLRDQQQQIGSRWNLNLRIVGMPRSILEALHMVHCSRIRVNGLQFLSCDIDLQALDQDRKSLNDKLRVCSAEYFLFLYVLLSKLVNVDQEAGHCSQIVWIIFLRVWVENWLEKLKVVEYLRKYVDQKACLDDLLSES